MYYKGESQLMRRTAAVQRCLVAALIALALPAIASAGPATSWPRFQTANVPTFHEDKGVLGAALIVLPPAAGCSALPPVAALIITLTSGAQHSSGSLTPCGPVSRLPTLDGVIVRLEPRTDTETGTELGLLPKASHKTYNNTVKLTAMMNGRLLFHRTLRVSMYWSPNTRVWEGTDQFVNYCIDQNRPTYSSGLRLYCNDPAVLLDQVQFNPA